MRDSKIRNNFIEDDKEINFEDEMAKDFFENAQNESGEKTNEEYELQPQLQNHQQINFDEDNNEIIDDYFGNTYSYEIENSMLSDQQNHEPINEENNEVNVLKKPDEEIHNDFNQEDQSNDDNQGSQNQIYFDPNFQEGQNHQHGFGQTQNLSELNNNYSSFVENKNIHLTISEQNETLGHSVNCFRSNSIENDSSNSVVQSTKSSNHDNSKSGKSMPVDQQNLLPKVKKCKQTIQKQQSKSRKSSTNVSISYSNENQDSSDPLFIKPQNFNNQQITPIPMVMNQSQNVNQNENNAEIVINQQSIPPLNNQNRRNNDRSKIKNHYRNFSKKLGLYIRKIHSNHWGIKKIIPQIEEQLNIQINIDEFIKQLKERFSKFEIKNQEEFRQQYTIDPELEVEEKKFKLWLREFSFQFFQEEVYIYIMKDHMRIPSEQKPQYLSICSKYLINIFNPTDNFMDANLEDCEKLFEQFI